MIIKVEVIPHEKQRYNTIGDWYYEQATLHIKVSKLNDWRKEMSVALHEFIEALLCRARGISEKSVTDFDVTLLNSNYEEEPGDLPEAPYHKEHVFATNLERLFVTELGLEWLDYEKVIEKVSQENL